MSVVRRHPLTVFFVLAYAFSWWPWPLYALGLAVYATEPGEILVRLSPEKVVAFADLVG